MINKVFAVAVLAFVVVTCGNPAENLSSVTGTVASAPSSKDSQVDRYKGIRSCFNTLYFLPGSRAQDVWGLSFFSVYDQIAVPDQIGSTFGFYLIGTTDILRYTLNESHGFRTPNPQSDAPPQDDGLLRFNVEINEKTRFTLVFHRSGREPKAIDAPRMHSENWYLNFPNDRLRDNQGLIEFAAHKVVPENPVAIDSQQAVGMLREKLLRRIKAFGENSLNNGFARDYGGGRNLAKLRESHRYWQRYFGHYLKNDLQTCSQVEELADIAHDGHTAIDRALSQHLRTRPKKKASEAP